MKVSEIRNKILLGKTNEVKGKCYFCGKEVDGMFWCFGCHHFVCEECDTNAGEAIGKHDVRKHQEQSK